MDFESRYKMLNDGQKQAVDQIDGPVFVIAGPGTGKTELLALRVASILKKDSTILPSNILCLTFTDAAANNMRSRLIRYIGQDAYKVAVHTFNSFGAYVMNAYPEFFYAWRDVVVADELVVHRILEKLLQQLPGDHPLAGRSLEGEFFAIRQLKNLISDAKKASLTPAALEALLDQNEKDIAEMLPFIRKYWPIDRMSAKHMHVLTELCDELSTLDRGDESSPSLKTILIDSLELAKDTSEESEKKDDTRPFTAWKNNWLEKDTDGQWILSASKHQEKLREATKLYESYQHELAKQHLADFNDQVLWVVEALQKNTDLRLNLQEKFLYIMIDEYQDTNRAQLALAQSLTDAAIHEGRPNIMVVGDDDQAIYRFQGADISNIHAFESHYNQPLFVTLSENYRSNDPIITSAKAVSATIELSLSNIKNIDKALRVNQPTTGTGANLEIFDSEDAHYAWIADEIKKRLDSGEKGSDIAILARERSQLDAMVPYLRCQGIAMDYERRENVLEQEHIVALLTMARFVRLVADEKHKEANGLIPQLLSHPMWKINAFDLWKISRSSHENGSLWLDEIEKLEPGNPIKTVCNFLIHTALQSKTLPLEQVLDLLIGTEPSRLSENEHEDIGEEEVASSEVFSPFKSYYFSEQLFQDKPEEYLQLLSHLSTLRRKLRSYQGSHTEMLGLRDLVDFVDAYTRAGLTMLDTAPHRENKQAVKLMTCHKAKGLEFDTVYIVGVTNGIWSKSGSGNSRFSYPENLKDIRPSNNDDDDALRLLFVAMTRAKQNLYICSFNKTNDGKECQLFAPLVNAAITTHDNTALEIDQTALIEQYRENWVYHHGSVSKAERAAYLGELLETYALSATHLNNFLDVSAGGPLFFLTQNLLNFPSSMSPHAQYGTAVHRTLKRAHEEVVMGETPKIDKLVAYFLSEMKKLSLEESRMQEFCTRGKNALTAFFTEKLASFKPSDHPEVDFKHQGVHIHEARIKGSLDLVSLDKNSKQAIVTDYKTGKSFTKWDVSSSSPEHDKIKLHKYRQQLLFYKLLLDGAADYGQKGYETENAILSFVEPDTYGKIRQLDIVYTKEELERTKALILAVWEKIMNLDFPDTSSYEPTLKGIIAFENSLLS